MISSKIVRFWFAFAALSGLVAVAAGAYASHGMTDPRAIAWVDTASQYQMWHALALLLVSLLASQVLASAGARRGGTVVFLTVAGWAFVLGMLLFSGSLYILAGTGDRSLSQGAPLGGMALMAGWLALAVTGLNWSRRGDQP